MLHAHFSDSFLTLEAAKWNSLLKRVLVQAFRGVFFKTALHYHKQAHLLNSEKEYEPAIGSNFQTFVSFDFTLNVCCLPVYCLQLQKWHETPVNHKDLFFCQSNHTSFKRSSDTYNQIPLWQPNTTMAHCKRTA